MSNTDAAGYSSFMRHIGHIIASFHIFPIFSIWAKGKSVYAGMLSYEDYVSVYALKPWKPIQWTPKTDTLTW